ncbi:alpha/beta hydrolase [Halioxenophilus sp. WMMB6]|uniref:alpha/beta hydrolase n=1 Tax=Halioxenophilus sp. WMMB6 TaxID=3073815 RepID=UPI00295EFE08|nr:alpha/beta hydrolase [Halioxenophilus sp. WMMB6]
MPVDSTAKPLVYLGGGPGAGLGLAENNITHWLGWYLQNQLQQPLILMDYRGVGLSTPNFRCSPFLRDYQTSLTHPNELAPGKLFQTTQECLAIWHQRGFSEEDFTVRQNAEDVVALLDQLQWQQADFYGVSYGTRVGQFLSEHFPERIGRIVLDSPVMASKTGVNYFPQKVLAAVVNYQDYCAETGNCSFSEDSLFLVLQALSAEPLSITFEQWHEPGLMTAELDDNLFLSVFYSGLYSPEGLTNYSWPKTAEAWSAEHLLQAVKKPLAGYINQAVDPEFNFFIYYANQCLENSAFDERLYSQPQRPARWQRYFAYRKDRDVCQMFKPPVYNNTELVADELVLPPILILSGELDPITPMRDALQLVTRFPTGIVLSHPDIGHGVLAQLPCRAPLLQQFLAGQLASEGPLPCGLIRQPVKGETAGVQ